MGYTKTKNTDLKLVPYYVIPEGIHWPVTVYKMITLIYDFDFIFVLFVSNKVLLVSLPFMWILESTFYKNQKLLYLHSTCYKNICETFLNFIFKFWACLQEALYILHNNIVCE